jgi:hypothetical protein
VSDQDVFVHNSCGGKYPKDFQSNKTAQKGAKFNSQGEARSIARTKVGRDPVNIGDNKLRSQNGKWQYRSEPGELSGHGKGQPHIHLEKLDPITGEIIENWHLYW